MPSDAARMRSIVIIAIYAAFAVIIVYLTFFNSGLEIKEELNTNGEKILVLENTTSRTIKNISVSYIDNRLGKILRDEKIESLIPKEKYKLDIETVLAPEIRIEAEASFYAKVQKVIVTSTEKPSIRTTIPKTVFFGQRFDFKLEYCNSTQKEEIVRVEEKHDNVFFLERSEISNAKVNPGECKEFNYNLLPAYRGETKIYFNVETSNSREEVDETLRVE